MKITAYKSTDGKIFENEKDFISHENKFKINELILESNEVSTEKVTKDFETRQSAKFLWETYTAILPSPDWTLCDSEKDFLRMYPPHIEGHYMPQPWTSPHQYPCLIKEICVMGNQNGSDHQILDFLYDFKIQIQEQ